MEKQLDDDIIIPERKSVGLENVQEEWKGNGIIEEDGTTVATLTNSIDLEQAPERWKGEGTLEKPFIVNFNEHDKSNPLNWTNRKKWTITFCASLSTMCVALGSSIYAGGLVNMSTAFNASYELILAGLSLYVLGFALGPLTWSAISESFGRKTAFMYSFLPFVLLTFGSSATTTVAGLLTTRFFTGCFGSAPLVNSGATISDMFNNRERSVALSLFALAPFLGPPIGAMVGGYIGEYGTWETIFYVEGAFSGLMFILTMLLVDETYAPVLLRRKALLLTKETGMIHVSEYDSQIAAQTLSQKLKVNFSRPFVMLLKEMIVFLMSFYAAIIYGVLYLCFSAFPIIFQSGYGFGEGAGGLAFGGVGVGMVIGVIMNYRENSRYGRMLDANEGKPLPPEARLTMTCVGGVMLPISLFWFAWTSTPNIHWIVPIIASAPFGAGMLLVFLSMTNYLVDVFTIYSASVLAANAVFRSLFGAAFPLFAVSLFEKLGTQWALSLFAFLSLICVPIPFLFQKYGHIIRKHSRFAPPPATSEASPSSPAGLTKVHTRHELEVEEDIRLVALRYNELARIDSKAVVGK